MAYLALDVTVKALLLVVLAQGVVLLLRGASSATRHLVWTVVAAGLVALPLLSLSLPRWGVPVPARVAPVVPAEAPVPPVRPVAPRPPVPAPAPTTPRAHRANEPARAPAAAPTAAPTIAPTVEPTSGAVAPASPSRAHVVAPAAAADVAGTGASAAPAGTTASFAERSKPPALIVAWLLGVLGVLSGMAISALRVRRMERAARPVTGGRVVAAARKAAGQLRLKRPIRLLESESDEMPMTWGVRRPVVLLPASAGAWPDDRLNAVLLHELAHVLRRDHLSQYVAEMACALHWFNPAAWLVARRLRVEREHACDDAALMAGSRASTYAAQLLDVARSLRAHRATSLAAMAMARPSQLTGRLLAVLDERRSRGRPTLRRRAATLLIGAVLVSGLAAASPRARIDSVEAPVLDVKAPVPAPLAAGVGTDGSLSFTGPTAKPVESPQQARSICDSDHHNSISFNSHDGDQHIHWKTPDCDIEVWIRGDVRLREDLSGIESVGSDGTFKVDADQQGTRRVLEVTSRGGQLRYAYSLDRKDHAYDAEAQRWLQSLLLGLARETGFGAEQRIAMLLRRGGPDAVIAEAEQISSDYVAGLYLKTLISKAKLTDDQMRRVAETGAREIQSDYELAELLITISRAHPVDASLRPVFLRAAGTIESDYEHARVLKAVLTGGRLSPQDVAAILASAGSIGSDYEQAELLVKTASSYHLNGAARAAYLASLKDIASDYERGRALKALLAQGDIAPSEQAAVIDAIAGIGSGYELAEALIAAVPKIDLSQRANQDSFVRAAARIDSDYEHARVLKTLVTGGRLQEEPLAMVLVSARSIGSDYELAELLVTIAANYRITGPLREAFLQTLKGVSPGYEHDRVAAALLNSETG